MDSEDLVFHRLRHSPQDVYVLFEDWWKKVAIERANNNTSGRAYPNREECEGFLAKYGWDLYNLFVELGFDTKDLVT